MKQKFYSVMLVAALWIINAGQVNGQLSAREIVRTAHEKANGHTSVGSLKMTIVRPGWTREITMKAWSKGTEYYMILITSPAKDKGQVFMKRDKDMWNWMPSINRMIKLPPSMMSQSWMGSDFTNDDLVRMNSIIDDFTHSIIGSEKLGEFDCHVIELIPKPEAAIVWGKIRLWISKAEFYELKGEYYDEDMALVNVMTASEIKQMGDRKLPSKMVMVPLDKPGNQTIFETMEMKFNTPIPDDFFSQQNMKNVR